MTASWRTVAKLPATPETQDTANSDATVIELADLLEVDGAGLWGKFQEQLLK